MDFGLAELQTKFPINLSLTSTVIFLNGPLGETDYAGSMQHHDTFENKKRTGARL
jgi:hypothetical protein